MKETKVVPKDFSAAVKDIKLVILQARARAARVSNVEALKLYFKAYTIEPIRYLSSNELRGDAVKAFASIGFTHHREVIRFCKDTLPSLTAYAR